MCGIVGYIGYRNAWSVIVDALHQVEYRGYDSCGAAIQSGQEIHILKELGQVDKLDARNPSATGNLGIGHTRWATVGHPTLENTHPLLDCSGRIAIVHNGHIENHDSLRKKLVSQGHEFQSETDSEVFAHLLEDIDTQDKMTAVAQSLNQIEGSYALAILFHDSDEIIVARKDNPLVIGIGDQENFIASDVPAILGNARHVIHLEDMDIATIKADGIKIRNNGVPVHRQSRGIDWSRDELDKSGYPHYMLKEIFEQPQVIRDAIAGRLLPDSQGVNLGIQLPPIDSIDSITLLGCGSAHYACIVGERFLNTLTPIKISSQVASDIAGLKFHNGNHWGLLVSQSGETADTIEAGRVVKEAGLFTVAFTNNGDSSITRLADRTVYLKAGPEISVAATKTFISQLVALYLFGIQLFPMPSAQTGSILKELDSLPGKVQQILDMAPQLEQIGQTLAQAQHAFIIGRGINYPVALEGALKLKEVAYLHAEGYASGELKHGPFALLTEETPVVAIMPQDDTYPRMLNAVQEIQARGAPIIVLTNGVDPELLELTANIIQVPPTFDLFSPIINTVALQLIAYYCAKERDCPIDRPRNLSKSVTVH